MLRPRFFCANAFSRTGYTFASPFAIAVNQGTVLALASDFVDYSDP
jgi:hypothetical protein